MFVSGLALFSVASLAGGFANSQGLLIAARAAQGLGEAVIAPASLSILTTTFTEGPPRNPRPGYLGRDGGAAGGLLSSIRLTRSNRSGSASSSPTTG